MLDKKQLDDLLYQLSSFYRDFLPVDNALLKLYRIYSQTLSYAWTVFQEAEDSRYITTTRTMRTIPYYKLSIDSAMYDLNTARILARESLANQIAYLDKHELYEPFSFSQADLGGEPTVASCRLFVGFTDTVPLVLSEDYFIRSNRLYLLPKYVQRKKKATHFLHAFDIKVNDNTLEKNFGTIYKLQTGTLFPRHKYRDVLEAFSRSMKGDMTIKQLRESIALSTKWETFKVEDKLSPTISPQKKKLYDDWIVSPNKFMITLPESLIKDKIEQNIVRMLLSEVKDVIYDYMIFFEIDRNDQMPALMDRKITYMHERIDGMIPESDVAFHKKMEFVDYAFDLFGRYDTTFKYDLSLQYDDPPGNEVISISQTGMTFRERTPLEESRTRVRVFTDPRIPRSFAGTKSNNEVVFSLKVNTNSTTKFEPHGADEESGPYSLIESLNNNPSGNSLTFQHHANSEGKRYYKARALSGNKRSLFTMPVDIQAL